MRISGSLLSQSRCFSRSRVLQQQQDDGPNTYRDECLSSSEKHMRFTSKLARKLRRFLLFLVVLLRPLKESDWLRYAKDSANATGNRLRLNVAALAAGV